MAELNNLRKIKPAKTLSQVNYKQNLPIPTNTNQNKILKKQKCELQ